MMEEAKKQADSLVARADEQTSEMVNEHEIMQRAYAHANEVVEQANMQAQAIVDQALNDANTIRQGSIQYTDDMLRSLQTIINHTMEGAKGRFDAFMSSMQSSYDIVSTATSCPAAWFSRRSRRSRSFLWRTVPSVRVCQPQMRSRLCSPINSIQVMRLWSVFHSI